MISSLLNDETEDSNAILAAIPWLVVDEDRGVVGSRTRQDARPPVRKLRALVEHHLGGVAARAWLSVSHTFGFCLFSSFSVCCFRALRSRQCPRTPKNM